MSMIEMTTWTLRMKKTEPLPILSPSSCRRQREQDQITVCALITTSAEQPLRGDFLVLSLCSPV